MTRSQPRAVKPASMMRAAERQDHTQRHCAEVASGRLSYGRRSQVGPSI